MRESRASTITEAKLKYPKCDRKKDHLKEQLNFICYSVHCQARGLICALCKSSPDHQGHSVLPLRSFLIKIEESLKKCELGQI